MALASSGWSGDELTRVNLELTPDEARTIADAQETPASVVEALENVGVTNG